MSIKLVQIWKRSFLITSMAPILFLGIIYITYGLVFNPFFNEASSLIGFFKLPNQLSIFNSDITLPFVVKYLGYFSVVLLNLFFVLWLSSFVLASYLKLSQQVAKKIEILIELIFISGLYFTIISPANVFIYLIGCFAIAFVLALIVLYWIYELKQIDEKR